MSEPFREPERSAPAGFEVSTLPPAPGESERLLANGRYRIQRPVGEGAYKKVFLATDTELARDVAIAIVRRATATRDTLVRFRREVQKMAGLGDHPNIVTVHDVGEEDGLTYIVSQYVAGGSVADRLRRQTDRRMPVADALALVRQVNEALDHAHRQAIVHRDLKPGNVLLTKEGTALLGDFGIAIGKGEVSITSEYVLVGTVPYMSPEQATPTSRNGPLDGRSDLYALGVMLYELLCGRLPFTGAEPEMIIAQHATAPRPSPRAANPAVPHELAALVMQLMAVAPADRPSGAAELRERLAAFSPARPPRPRAPALDSVRLPPALATPPRRSFVGREDALATLRGLWVSAGKEEPRAALVRGNAGIGKTRLCARFAHEVHAGGGTVLYGRCEEEALVPYAPFVTALRHFAPHRPWLPELLDLPAGFELARLGWPVPGADLQASARERTRAAERYELFEASVLLVKAMASSAPLLVIFDDLHWADMPTLRLLRHLIRFVDSGKVMLVCTERDDEPEAERVEQRDAALAELRRELVVATVELEGLSEAETASLVSAREREPVEPDIILRLRERTGGNPLWIEETLRSAGGVAKLPQELADSTLLHKSVPKAIEVLVERRLSGLGEQTRKMLELASIIGREFNLGLLAPLARCPVADITDALEEAIRDGILVDVPGFVDRFAFCHALVRLSLLERQKSSDRMRRHARCGETLEARYANSPPHAAELAYHFFLARDGERALRYSRAAAEWASDALAYEDVAFHRQRALDVLDESPDLDAQRCDLLLSRGRALWRAGDTKEARRTFQKAAKVADRLEDAERFASAALGFGHRYYDPGEIDTERITLLEEAEDRLGERDSGSLARVLAGKADALHFQKHPDYLREVSQKAVQMAERLGDNRALVVALAGLHAASLWTKYLSERLDLSERMLDLVGTDGPAEHTAHALHWRLYDLFEAGDMETARLEHERLADLAERLRQPLYRHFAAAWEAKWKETAGEFAEAEELADRSQDFALRAHMPYAHSNYAGQLFGLRRDQGLLDQLPDEVRIYIGDRPRLPVWRAGMVLAHLDAEHEDRARADFEALAQRDFRGVPLDLFWLGAMCLLAEACGRLGDRRRADKLYPMLQPYAGCNAQIGLAVSVGFVDRFLGRLAALRGYPDEAEEHFEAALAHSERVGAITSIVHINYEYAEMLLERDTTEHRERAGVLLERSRLKAEELHMAPVADRARMLADRYELATTG